MDLNLERDRMAIKVVSEMNSIKVKDMKDGDIGVITNWGHEPEYVGKVVQRYYSTLITVGAPGGQSWSDFYAHTDNISDNLTVTILRPGTMLEITE